MHVLNLTGAALAWAVAQVEQVELLPPQLGNMFVYTKSTGKQYDPCLDGNLFIILMNKHRISVEIGHDGVWLAYDLQNYADEKRFCCSGVSMQQAAMRCLVYRELGENIHIPKALR